MTDQANQPTSPAPQSTGEMPSSIQELITLAVGNTRSRIGLFRGKELDGSLVIESSDAEAIAQAAIGLADQTTGDENPAVVIGSVNSMAADTIEAALIKTGLKPIRFGEQTPIPVAHTLDDEGIRTVGQDRLLCAAGAFAHAGQACVVVDLGTALTIDFVDGEGVFHGGAIAPGLDMMLSALAERTAALPRVQFERDQDEVIFGKNTPAAMRLGVHAMVNGAVRFLAERYADFYEAYPRIIATGGDMGVLEGDELVEAFLPDLQLHGIRVACERLLASEDE